MLNNLNKNQLYFSITISFVLFIFMNFSIGPTSVFGLAEFIQNKTGYFFGVDTNTLDYFLVSLIPFFALLLNSKKNVNSFTEIIKDNLTIVLCCISTFSIGLFFLITKIGSPITNPLIPVYLRVEPFKIYSTFLIGIGIILPFLMNNKYVEKKENEIEEMEDKNKKL
jgi:nitric oxide reductase large subunit